MKAKPARKHREPKDLSTLLDPQFNSLNFRMQLAPLTEEEKRIYQADEAVDPLDSLRNLPPGKLPEFIDNLVGNLRIYFNMLAKVLSDERSLAVVEPAIAKIAERTATEFEKQLKRPLQLFQSISPSQGILLVAALQNSSRIRGVALGGTAVANQLYSSISTELKRVATRLREKHWLTDTGFVELILEMNKTLERDELDSYFEEMGVGESLRKQLWAAHPEYRKARDEWWIYRDKDGEYHYSKPSSCSDEVVEKGIDGVDAALYRVTVLNNAKG